MAKTLGEQLLSATKRSRRDPKSNTACCSVCGKLLHRQDVSVRDPYLFVFGLTVLLVLPMLCGGLYLLWSNLNSRSNQAIVDRCHSQH